MIKLVARTFCNLLLLLLLLLSNSCAIRPLLLFLLSLNLLSYSIDLLSKCVWCVAALFEFDSSSSSSSSSSFIADQIIILNCCYINLTSSDSNFSISISPLYYELASSNVIFIRCNQPTDQSTLFNQCVSYYYSLLFTGITTKQNKTKPNALLLLFFFVIQNRIVFK